MPKFARPNSYTGKQSNQHWTGDVRAANATEAAAGESETLYISPATLASAVDDLLPDATTTSKGKVELATLTELQNGSAPAGAWVPTANDVATVIAGVVVGAVPPATTTQQGIVELATDAQVVTPFTTDVPNTAVQPSNITAMFAAPEPIGATTPNSGTFTFVAASATGTGNTLVSDTASLIDVTGAGIDLTLSSDAGRVVINGEEAAADAVRILSAAGGLDADVALQMNLASSQNAADAIRIVASAGGIDVDAVGAAGEDINITNTGGSIVLSATESAADSILIQSTAGGIDITATGAAAGEDIDITTSASVNITATENNAGAVIVRANGGTSERVTLLASQGTAADSINLESTAGGVTLTSNLATADGINLNAIAGGIDVDAALQINIASSQNAIDAIRIVSSAGGIDIDAVGAATEDINITNTGGSVVIAATEADAGAITLTATTALGGIDVNAGTGGMTVDSGGVLSLDSAGATNLTATGAFDITIQSTAGSILLNAGEAVTDAINIDSTGGFDLDAALEVNITSSEAAVADSIRIFASAADGGIDIDSGTGGMTLDTTGALSLQGAAASDFSVSGAGIDLTLASASGSVKINSGEDTAGAIALTANAGTSETITVTASQGTGVASVNISSTAGGVTIAGGLATADAINLTAASGGVDVDGALQINVTSSQAAATAIQLTASDAGAGGITATVGAGNFNVAGNLALTSAATQFIMNGGGATDFIGQGTLIAGTVTIANTNIAANDRIFVQRSALNGTPALGFLVTTISAGASFTVAAYSVTGAAAVTDVSSFDYFIVRQT